MRIESFSDIPLRSSEANPGQYNTDIKSIQSETSSRHASGIAEDQLQQLIEHGNKVLQRMDTRLQWTIHQKSKQFIVKVMDTQTNEVIREIPPEKYLDLVQNLCEQIGLFLDERT